MAFWSRLAEDFWPSGSARDEQYAQATQKINQALLRFDALLDSSNSRYLTAAEPILAQCQHLLDSTGNIPITSVVFATQQLKGLFAARAALKKRVNNYPALVEKHNAAFLEVAVERAREQLDPVEGRTLDRQQLESIVRPEHSTLVIAGAGTGKTTTIVGKVKYILLNGLCAPEDILVLSFTNAAASEMRTRLNRETNAPVTVSTFHKLGLAILRQVEGETPRIISDDLLRFVRSEIDRQLAVNPGFAGALSTYLLFGRVIPKSEFSFTSQKEYSEYLEIHPPATLKGVAVKSYGEMAIANFLTQHGIAYEYERPYPVKTNNEEYGQYCPDFHLPEHDVYIEYFAIDKNGNVPSWFTARHGENATRSYRRGMTWKRELHSTNGTKLIECYAHEQFDGVLLSNLKKKLAAAKIPLHKLTIEQLFDAILADKNAELDGLAQVIQTVINLARSRRYGIDDLKRIVSAPNMRTQRSLVALIEPILATYEARLREDGGIDFSDMINRATDYVANGSFHHHYRIIIVDEYQDISTSQYQLLHAMRADADFALFCVGDDWQSIYRFAGSDINYILDFEKYWGPASLQRIETTYRFPPRLVYISSTFIQRNPRQLRKELQSAVTNYGSVLSEIHGYTENAAARFMIDRLMELPKNSSVFFIGRYKSDCTLLQKQSSLTCRYNKAEDTVGITLEGRPDLSMFFYTAHRSKGLQADYVFIINNKPGRMGFPSRVQNPPLVEALLEAADTYAYAEERRLYYVALTRARKKVFLLTAGKRLSSFASEIKYIAGDDLHSERYVCPLCGGSLKRIHGRLGDFWGCSNYRKLGCRYMKPINAKQ